MEKQALDLQGIANTFVQQAIKEFGNIRQIQERPFEILLQYVVPGILMLKGRWILSLLFSASKEVLGVDAGTIGAWIDRAIGKGPGSGNTGPVSESSLESASGGIVDRLVGGLLGKSSAFRAELEKRGTIDRQSLVVAWTHGSDNIGKEAAGNLASKFRSLMGMGGYASKGLISGALYQLLKAVIIGFGLHAGTGAMLNMVGIGNGTTSQTSGNQAPSAPGMRLYMNTANNVERSLIMTLDNAIKDRAGKPFSRIFIDLKGYSPVGSKEMKRVLTEVGAAHGGAPIQEINSYRTFAAPPLAEMARILLPQATYTKEAPADRKSQTEKELEGAFGGPR